ncbi:MAG: SET domain-containing protein [Actinobacteria bacterium]|nr:SET domain-containing protein [Actinomycetota bacterium]
MLAAAARTATELFWRVPRPVILRPVPVNFLTPLAQVRPAKGAGFGSYAIAPIPAGTIVAAFGGTPMDRATFDRQDPERRSRSIQIDDDTFLLGPVVREPGDAVNHSCEPNCGMCGAAQVVAMRDIAVGEALTFDYAMSDGSNYDEFDCVCGTTKCRSRISGDDWKRDDLQDRYAGYFTPYLTRRIAARHFARRLSKHDVETLMTTIDDDPHGALTVAMRIALGRPRACLETLVRLAPLDPAWRTGLLAGRVDAIDRLAALLNEARGFAGS